MRSETLQANSQHLSRGHSGGGELSWNIVAARRRPLGRATEEYLSSNRSPDTPNVVEPPHTPPEPWRHQVGLGRHLPEVYRTPSRTGWSRAPVSGVKGAAGGSRQDLWYEEECKLAEHDSSTVAGWATCSNASPYPCIVSVGQSR